MLDFLHKAKLSLPPKALTSLGQPLHPNLVSPGKSDKFRLKVFLNSTGKVAEVQRVSDIDDWRGHYVYNVSGPSAPRALILRFNRLLPQNWHKISVAALEALDSKLSKRVCQPFDTLVEEMRRGGVTEHPVVELRRRIALRVKSTGVGRFLQEIAMGVRDELKKDAEVEDPEAALLEASAILENYSAAREGTGGLVHQPSSYLSMATALTQASSSTGGKEITDIYGERGPVDETPFRPVNVSGLGRVAPYARNKDSSSNASYGMNGVGACPLTTRTKLSLSQIHAFLLQPTHRQVYWQSRTTAIGKRSVKYLTLAIPVGVPASAQHRLTDAQKGLLAFLGVEENLPADPQQTDMSAEVFREHAEAILKVLSGVVANDPVASYEMVFVKQVGDAPYSTDAEESIPLGILKDCINEWKVASGDAPRCSFALRTKVKGEFNIIEARPVKPLYVPVLLNRRWTRTAGYTSDGRQIKNYFTNITSSQFSFHDGLRLFLRNDPQVIDRAIRQIASCHVWLMYDVASRYRQGGNPLLYRERLDVLRMPELISILQAKRGFSMDETKAAPAFLMGQVVGLADRIHRQWCLRERNGHFPRTFVGSDAAPSFLSGNRIHQNWRNFIKRWRHFEDWASRNSRQSSEPQDPKDNLSPVYYSYRKHLRELEKVDQPNPIPDRFTPADIVLFSLGFFTAK
jgi:hypothetical protein